VPAEEQQVPTMPEDWQNVVEVQAPLVTFTPIPWNMPVPVQPMCVVTLQVVPVQQVPRKFRQTLSGEQVVFAPAK